MKKALLLVAVLVACLAVPVLAAEEDDEGTGENLRAPYVSYWVHPATDRYPYPWFKEEANEDRTLVSVPTPPVFEEQTFRGWTVVANSQSGSYLLGTFDTISPNTKFDIPFAHPEYEYLVEYVIFLKYTSTTPEPTPVDEPDGHSLYYVACVLCIIACIALLLFIRRK